ncbi:hypothetical protein LMG28138_03062 [Pararobbsia alpina]|uniref:Uncharacterized protein n=1 Tax=Pararobbsia alpina TaxID=621374 RepID=A0A6S7B8L8_9BURK|nr:hypothetical protein LMG28138_03062 [Pararobbsia alpina]
MTSAPGAAPSKMLSDEMRGLRHAQRSTASVSASQRQFTDDLYMDEVANLHFGIHVGFLVDTFDLEPELGVVFFDKLEPHEGTMNTVQDESIHVSFAGPTQQG